ncbi:hypothetical protein AB1K54_16560 [Microbacterium sp. BWT-B31]|uniref:hypothetical protein n=1 Tax=Microbacterium sp. BWT-B31 TaxID=3232072 RepID=UPI003527258D
MTGPLDDDMLDRFMRATDPALTPADAPLTVRHIAIRDRIMMDADPEARRRRPHLTLWLTSLPVAVTVVIVALIVITGIPLGSTPAVALTPPPLTFTKTGQTTSEVLMEAQRALAEDGTPAEPLRSATSTGWYLQMGQNAEGVTTTATVSPQITTVRWAPDGSGQFTVVAGEPYWGDGSPAPTLAPNAPPPGTVISDSNIPTGGIGVPTTDPPGSTEAEMAAWLVAMGLPADADAADLIDTINLAMNYWTLTNQQHSLLLKALLTRDDVDVVGTGRDRAGRDVVGITTDSTRFPGSRRLLLISTETGRIVAEEVLRTTPLGKLPAGSVISYTLWGLPTT